MILDLDQWLKRTLEEVAFDAGPSMRKFLMSTEADCKRMDADLSAGMVTELVFSLIALDNAL